MNLHMRTVRNALVKKHTFIYNWLIHLLVGLVYEYRKNLRVTHTLRKSHMQFPTCIALSVVLSCENTRAFFPAEFILLSMKFIRYEMGNFGKSGFS